jgi:hypothetical protein
MSLGFQSRFLTLLTLVEDGVHTGELDFLGYNTVKKTMDMIRVRWGKQKSKLSFLRIFCSNQHNILNFSYEYPTGKTG